MKLDAGTKVELLTAAVMFLGLCQMIYLIVRNDRADAKDRVPPPVRIGALQRLRIALNPGKLRRAAWPPGQATVQQVYLIPHHSFKTLVSYPSIGMRTSHPFKTQTKYSFGVWYHYIVNKKAYWGRQSFVTRYGSREEAQQQAALWAGKTFTIRYDPDYPEDSQLDR